MNPKECRYISPHRENHPMIMNPTYPTIKLGIFRIISYQYLQPISFIYITNNLVTLFLPTGICFGSTPHPTQNANHHHQDYLGNLNHYPPGSLTIRPCKVTETQYESSLPTTHFSGAMLDYRSVLPSKLATVTIIPGAPCGSIPYLSVTSKRRSQ